MVATPTRTRYMTRNSKKMNFHPHFRRILKRVGPIFGFFTVVSTVIEIDPTNQIREVARYGNGENREEGSSASHRRQLQGIWRPAR